jgi:hyperosmotically inducible periplasmic protein
MKVHRHVTAVIAAVLIATLAACAGGPAKRSTGEYIDDKTINTKVKAALLNDAAVSGIQVNVETYNGVVQLSGFVDDPDQIPRATEVAQGVEGVRAVRNDMIVRPPRER